MLESVKMLVPQKKRQAWYGFDRRPKHFHLAERLTKCSNDAQEWRKPEISAHTGHKIDNAIDGLAAATACALLGLDCTVYMGYRDIQRQSPNAFHLKRIDYKVVSIRSGSQALRYAINEIICVCVADIEKTHSVIQSAILTHPFPTTVRFQAFIGYEAKGYMLRVEKPAFRKLRLQDAHLFVQKSLFT
ncbi:unnamed protein product [Albugo candida]|uniref:Uncharacterized protein n=1 Tax=Albugo candida TaxID=65357 RepID=A0A024GV40_9STRA|nr:unnamed protein product [Albugo candida]|eukprot:CCI50609.1 unnamed protein product [Albugo candida]